MLLCCSGVEVERCSVAVVIRSAVSIPLGYPCITVHSAEHGSRSTSTQTRAHVLTSSPTYTSASRLARVGLAGVVGYGMLGGCR